MLSKLKHAHSNSLHESSRLDRKVVAQLITFTCSAAMILLSACSPTVAEQREFPMCVREHYATVKKVYNRETGEPEYMERDQNDPAVWEVICGLGGNGYTNWEIRKDQSVYDGERLIAKDTPIPGKTVTLDCYVALPARPEAPRWKRSVWFKTDDGHFCRVPKGLHLH